MTHFACVCPKFREARTAAHNQLRAVVAASLKSTLSEDWHTFEEKSLAATGLRLQRVRAELEEVSESLARGESEAQDTAQDTVDISRWQPDFVRSVPASQPKNPCSKRRERGTARALRAGVNAHGWGRGGMREGMEGLKILGAGRVNRTGKQSAFWSNRDKQCTL